MNWTQSRRKRDRLIIPGSLLAFHSLLAWIVVSAFTNSGPCGDSMAYISGLCYRVWPVLAALTVLGAGLVAAGALLFPSPERTGAEQLAHGSAANTTLALLSSLVAAALGAYIIQSYRSIDQGVKFRVLFDGIAYNQANLLLWATLATAAILTPYAVLYAAQARRLRSFVGLPEAPQEEPVVVPPGAPDWSRRTPAEAAKPAEPATARAEATKPIARIRERSNDEANDHIHFRG